MDKPLAKQQSFGPHRRLAQGHRNPLRDAECGQHTCALYSGQHKTAGPCAESTSTCDRRIRKGGHGNIHKDGNWIEYVDCTRSGTYEEFLSCFWTK